MVGSISIKVDDREVQRALKEFGDRDSRFIVAYALTKTGQDIRAAEKELMARTFDKPTPYTLNALYLKPATKQDPTAIVEFKDGGGKNVPAWRYLGPQVEGGSRARKSHELRLTRAGLMRADEYAVPGPGAQLDAYGNMRGSTIERILSQVQAAEQVAGFDANETARSRKRNKSKATGRYIALRPGGASGRANSDRQVPPGIYLRQGARSIVPVILFVKAPRYHKRYPFYEEARKVFDDRFPVRLREGFQRFAPKQRA